MHDLPYVVTGGTAIGILSTPIQINKCKIGQRGKDKQTRRPKRCSRCVENGGRYAIECSAKAGEVLFIASIMMKTVETLFLRDDSFRNFILMNVMHTGTNCSDSLCDVPKSKGFL